MRKDQVDLANIKVVLIADSKTPTRVSEVPLTDFAVEAFRSPMEVAGPGQWLFPSAELPNSHQTNFKKTREEQKMHRGQHLKLTIQTGLRGGRDRTRTCDLLRVKQAL